MERSTVRYIPCMTCMASFLLILGAAFRIASSIAIVIRSDSDALVAPVCGVCGQSYYYFEKLFTFTRTVICA